MNVRAALHGMLLPAAAGLLGYAFGWQAGIGFALLAIYLREPR